MGILLSTIYRDMEIIIDINTQVELDGIVSIFNLINYVRAPQDLKNY